MKIWILITCVFSTVAFAVERIDQMEVCDFYREKSAELGCQKSNYLTNFGLYYCRAFLELEGEFSPAGQKTFHHIRNCLVSELKNAPNLSCRNSRALAEKSHLTCYHASGYCDLPVSDKWVVFKTIWTELSDPAFRDLIYRINEDCGHT